MERTMISFNIPNIITVVLMGAIGYGAWALIRQLMLHNMGGASGPAPSLGGY